MKSSVERTGLTDLMRAAVDEDPTVLLKLLLTGNYDANLFMRDKKGRTALDWARMCRNYHAVSILLQAMSSGISNARLDAMHSPLELEVYIKETNAYQAAELLKALKNRDVPYTMRILSENKLYREEVEGLGEVFFVDAVAHSGYTPLVIAAGFGMVEVIDSLLEYKTPIDHANKFGHTAFTYACAAGNSDIARMLLFFGADVHHTTAEGRTGLHYCCMYAKARTVKVILNFLLERFATFRIEGHSMIDFDSTRWTKYAEILEGLINVRDKNGKLATDLIPDQLRTGYSIEARLRITGVAELPRLNQAPRDERSVQTNYGYAYNESDDISAVSELNDDFSFAADPADVGDGLNFGINTAREPLEDSFVQQESSFLEDGIEPAGNFGDSQLVGDRVQAENGVVPYNYNPQDTARDEVQSQISEVSANTFQSAAQFTHDTDNMHAVDIHNITDAHSVRTAIPLDQEVDTIKALFKRTRERISDWLASAEKEKELARLLPCVLNCGMMCKVENLTFHVRDDCPLRSILCQLCNKPVRFIDMKKHKAKLCPKRVVACPNAYHGCCEQVTVETTEAHIMLKCKVRKMVCRQFCGASIPYNKREKHELLHCKNRTIQCDQCGESMVANAYTEHLHTTCPERMIKCSISCGLSFKAKDIVKHEAEVCVGTCKWGCGRRIGPPEQLALHEACHCSEKPMQCKYRCGVRHMTVKDVLTHEQLVCENRPIMCTLGCGKTFPARLQCQHLETVRGSCAERPVRCPSNLIGWRIMILLTNKEGIVLQYRRITKMVDVVTTSASEVMVPSSSKARDSAIVPASDPVLASSNDPKLPAPTDVVVAPVREQREAEVDQLFVRFEGQQQWIDYWTSHYILLRKVQGDNLSKTQHIDHKFACGWVTFADMNDHLSHECVNREIYLTGDNDKQVSYVGQKTKFKEAVEVAEKRHKFDHFIENNVVKPSTEFCGFCSAEIDILSMEAHLKNTCIEHIVKCPYVCGMEMKRKELDAHLSDACPKRVVLCVDCNSRDLWAEELMSHQQHLCDMRIIPCPLKCDDDKVTACGVDAHCTKECILRPIQCSCGLTMPFKDLDEHQRLHCNDRYYYCPQGCGVQIKQENQEYHTEFQCSNKNFRYQKDVDCPNTCGAIMMIRDVLTHLSYHCPRRMVECTLNCGNTVQLDRLAGHMIFCPMRILPCEPGMHACNRPLHAWFHIEERPPEDDFTNSLFDFDGDDEPSEYGEAVVDTNSVNTSTILSRDGKTIVKFSDVDLARAGLASPEDRRRHKVQLLDTAAIDDKPQSRAQIARRIAKTDQIIRSVLPEETPRADDAPKTLFAAKEINIQFDKKGTLFQSLRVQKADKVSPRAGPDDHNAIYMGARSLASNSSVYHDGFQMKFHHHLRMHVCTLHRASMVFSALRHNDFALMEHVSKQIKDSEDIDFENIYGDTALTLACRMGKLNFIELLVEHAADINMETSNGRTALIEAVKAPVENIPVIEYLISCGCLVNYKTSKHQRTALHWAQRMNRTKTIRILELAILVQVQANKIFFAISTGKFEYVKDMIKEGEFFDANGEARFYAEMKKYADLEDDTHDLLEATKKKLALRGNTADVALQKYKDSLQEQDLAQDQLDQAFAAEDAVNQRISREFAMFEKNSLRLTPVDIQEVVALKKPELLLRLAGFGFAVMFGVLESDDWSPVTPCNVQSCLKWWPILMKEFQRPNEVVRKIQSFTVARLEGGRAVDLITRAKQLFEDMVEALAAEKKKRLTTGSSLETSLTSPGSSLVRSKTISNKPLQRLGSFVEDTAGSTDLALAGENTAETAPIPDADWDSEAEDEATIAGTGNWVMGEWVPIVTKKDKWWEKHAAEKAPERDPTHFHKAKAKSKFVYLSDEIISKTVKQAPIEAGMQIVRARTPGVAPSATSAGAAGGSLNEGSVESMGSVDLGGALVEATESDLDSEGGTSRASSRGSSAQSPNRPARKQQNRKLSRAESVGAGIGGANRNAKGRTKGSKSGKERSRGSKRNKVQDWDGPARSLLDIPIEEHLSVLDYETFECLPFIEAMFFMFKAIVRYTEDRQNLVEAKKVTSKSSIHNEDSKLKVLELKEVYDGEFNFRAEMEGQMIELMKKERFYKQRVKSFMEKVRVARLMNEVSMNGHTAVSWAAANGAYELVEEMLTHGATVGFTIPMLNLTATYLQQTYKIYKLNCQANYRHPEDCDAPPPPKVDSIQMVRDITALKEVRDKVLSKLVFMRSRTRFPVPEAVYAGKWEIVKRIYERRLYHAQFSNTWIFPQAPFPYLRKLDKQYEKTKMNIREVLSYGMNDNAAGTYVPSVGWVGPNDHREPFGETQHEIATLLLDLHMKNQLFLAGRKRIRLLAEERINQRTGERAMLKAIKAKDFRKCIELAVKRGITIDLETPEGYTVMLCAAEENVDATNHVFMHNDDGRECLAVEYLLDRMYYRPSVNMEGVVSGHNALIRATILSRAQVVEALLDRGADINYQNRVGRTALHYAAAAGDTVCTRILIERFADKTLKDNNNQTAYEIADSENFSNIMKLLSQFRGGFLGPVQISRGRVNNVVKCPLGCGQNMFPREQEAHCLVCEWRPAPCPLDCGDRTLQWKELPDHVERYCGKRIVMCEDCDIDLEARELEHHKADLCIHRLIQCSLGCGYDCKFCDIERHQIHCSWRVIACPLACDENMRAKDSAHHVKELCENRRVPCPYRCRGLVVCKLVPIHMETLCQNRPVFCQFCATSVTKQEQERHQKECDFRTVPCIDKCGELVPLAQMSVHLDTTCSHRFVVCVQNCGVKIRVKNMDFHTSTQCPERLSFCENGCLVSELVPESERQVQKVLAKVMHLHLKYECPERQNRCSMCLNYVKAKHCAKHDKEECSKRIVPCRVEGCLKQLAMEELEHHERHTCRFRLVVCKQSCGMRIPFIHSGIHMKNACVCRYLDCPLRCATRLRFAELEEHLAYECTRRHMISKKDTEANTLVAAAFKKAQSPDFAQGSPSRNGSPNNKQQRGGKKVAATTGDFSFSEEGESGKSKKEVYSKINSMSVEVSDSLKMLALGDKAWTSRLVGSRKQSPPKKNRPRSSEAKSPVSGAAPPTPAAKEEDV